MKISRSIKTRLTLWYLLATSVLVGLFGVLAYFLLEDGLSNDIINPWDIREADISFSPDGNSQVVALNDISGTMVDNPMYNVMRLSGEKVLETSAEDGTIAVGTPEGNTLLINRAMLTQDGTISGDEMILYIYVSRLNPQDLRLLITTRSKETLISILAFFKAKMSIAGIITIFGAALVGFLIIWWQLRPLSLLVNNIKQSLRSNDSKKFDTYQTDEVGELAEALNRLFDQTETDLKTERQTTSDISHELRTPLAIAQAEASLALTRERDSEEYRRSLENISREIFHLSSLVDKLLFLSRSDTASCMNVQKIDLTELIDEVIPSIEILCELKEHTFKYHPFNSDELVVTGDPTRIRELILNLVDNAVNYTPNGGSITLSVKRQNHSVEMSIRDTGIGIDSKYIPYLFNRFYRIEQSHSSKHRGTGLGLSICQKIAQMYNGSISVQSKPGGGSTFTIVLPMVNGD